MSIPYLITFTPTGRFYFGTSQSFGEGYYAVSSMFPSQTTILGTLRASILEKKGLLHLQTRTPNTTRMTEVHALTGKSEMKSLDEAGTDNDFGKILKLSPVFIVKQKDNNSCPEDFLLPVPADVFSIDGLKLIEYPEEKNVKTFSRNSEHDSSYHYNKRIKEPQAEYLGGIQFWQEYKGKKKLTFHESYLMEKIFVPDSQPGIARKDRNKRDEYFYKKKDFRLAKEYSFGVIVHFAEEEVLEDRDVFIGGERSLFRMKLKKLPLTLSHIYTEHLVIKRFIDEKDFTGDYDGSKDVSFNKEKLVLFSPFVGSDSSLQDLEFALINKMYTPRSLSSRTSKSDSFRTIPAGSVLFPGKQFKKITTYYPIPLKIGYNFAIKF